MEWGGGGDTCDGGEEWRVKVEEKSREIVWNEGQEDGGGMWR